MDRVDQLVTNPDEPINPWARLRDDILMIWTGSIDQLTQFMTWLNGICQSLKFTYTHSSEGVEFLELFVYVADNFILAYKILYRIQTLYILNCSLR